MFTNCVLIIECRYMQSSADCCACSYLTGNPCTEYEGYWEYVIATLPQLQV